MLKRREVCFKKRIPGTRSRGNRRPVLATREGDLERTAEGTLPALGKGEVGRRGGGCAGSRARRVYHGGSRTGGARRRCGSLAGGTQWPGVGTGVPDREVRSTDWGLGPEKRGGGSRLEDPTGGNSREGVPATKKGWRGATGRGTR